MSSHRYVAYFRASTQKQGHAPKDTKVIPPKPGIGNFDSTTSDSGMPPLHQSPSGCGRKCVGVSWRCPFQSVLEAAALGDLALAAPFGVWSGFPLFFCF